MPHDAAREEAADWMARAREDLRAADVGLAAHPPLLADASFHCQQAVEKALKGLLALHDEPFRKTHNIDELAAACVEHEPSLALVLNEGAGLTEYAWRFRYPGQEFEPDRAEVDDALDIARRVVAAVAARTAEAS